MPESAERVELLAPRAEPTSGTDALASPLGILLPAPRWSGSELRTRRGSL